jgi:hypothetical protein
VDESEVVSAITRKRSKCWGPDQFVAL